MGRMKWCLLGWLALAGAGCGGNAAGIEDRGAKVGHVKSAGELKQMMDGGDVFVVHSLDAANFEKGHVPGAVNIDYEKMSPEMLPGDKNKRIVFYCVGGMCPVGKMAASRAAGWGYVNAMVYEGGMRDWEAAGMSVAKGQ